VAAVLAGICMLLLLVQQAISYVHLKRQAVALDAEVTRVFNEAVPGGRQQLGSELTDLQGRLKQLQGGNAAGALLPLLDALGDGLASNPSIQVTGLNYQGGSLQAQLQATDVGALDALKTALARRSGLNVSLDSVNASGGQVTGRMVLAGSPT
jgi:type II secretion system protein L